jgi:four helix bundle protein
MIFRLSLKFPPEERYDATNQIRRTSRSVTSGIAEAWRWRFYPAKFTSKIIEVEGEAAETQSWLDMALDCDYITKNEHGALNKHYEGLLGRLVNTRLRVDSWGRVNATHSSPKLQKP